MLKKIRPWQCLWEFVRRFVPLLIISRDRCLFHSPDGSQRGNSDVRLASFFILKSSLGSCLHSKHFGHSFLWDFKILNMQCQSQESQICFSHIMGAFYCKNIELARDQLKGSLVEWGGVFCSSVCYIYVSMTLSSKSLKLIMKILFNESSKCFVLLEWPGTTNGRRISVLAVPSLHVAVPKSVSLSWKGASLLPERSAYPFAYQMVKKIHF